MKEFDVSTEMMDVEIIHISGVNVIARGRRYGRCWLLKGLIEQCRDSSVDLRRLQKEFEIQSRLLDPGVAQVVSFEVIDGLGHCIIEEWVEGKPLSEFLKEGKLSKKERRGIMRELISIVGYIHSMGLAHRNINPANVMVRDMGVEVVLTDFGFADTEGYCDDIYGLGKIMAELCPEYATIAARCVGSAKKRPKDIARLLKSLDRCDRLPKVIWSILGAAVIIGIGIVMGLYFHSLNSATMDTRDKVLALSETTRRQEMQVIGLNDSLTRMAVRINKVQDDIKRMDDYNEMRKEIYAVAFKKIDRLFEDFENNVVPMFDKDNRAFYDSVTVLLDKSLYLCNTDYDPKRLSELNEKDALELHNELVAYSQRKYSTGMHIWIALINNSSDVDVLAAPARKKRLSDIFAEKKRQRTLKRKKESGKEYKISEEEN
ncbi:MAG: protein kinase [Muribaculaceae bacterium]|nr:protein kinase [Muribaculaceae bacterium]